MTTDPLRSLESDLVSDPEIKAAHEEFEASCDVSEEDCWACSTKRAILLLGNMSHDDPEELALILTDGLEDALNLVAACQRAIQFLSDLTLETTSIIHFNELHGDDDEDDEREN